MAVKVVRKIERLRAKGLSYRAIADTLNAAGVATAHGTSKRYG